MKILYIYKKSIHNIKLAENNLFPKLFYGYFELKNKINIEIMDTVKNRPFIVQKIINIFSRFINFEKYDEKYLNSFDIIYATTDGIAIDIARLKKEGKVRSKVIANVMSIADNEKQKEFINDLKYVDYKICFSMKMYNYLKKKRLNNIKFIDYGIDTEFYHPTLKESDNSVLSIGLDRFRDWKTFTSVAKKLPHIKFKVITQNENKSIFSSVENIIFLGNTDFVTTKKEIDKAEIVFLPTLDNHYFSGQTTLFNCLAMKKYVLMPYDKNFEGYDMDISMFYAKSCTIGEIANLIEDKIKSKDNSLEYNYNSIMKKYNEKKFAQKILGMMREVYEK